MPETAPPAAPSAYRASVDGIETAYEFMLAYAAQGRDREGVGGDASPIRAHLETMRDGLAVIAEQARAEAASGGELPDAFAAFVDVLEADARVARTKVELALSLRSIGSAIVDNMNASIHVRALLTDIFLLDEYLKARRRGG